MLAALEATLKLSPAQLSQLIHQMNRMDLARADYGYIKQKVVELIDGFAYFVRQAQSGESLFRVRPNPPSRPVRRSDLGAPPPEAVRGFQRCNPPGVPYFYAASRRITALKESRVSLGDVVYLSEWGGAYPFPACLVFDPKKLPMDGADASNNVVQAYFDTLMTRRVAADFSDEYKLTAAITEQFTTKHFGGDASSVGEDGSLAVVYPSVFDRESSFNWAMPAAFAVERLMLRHVTELVVVKAPDGMGFRALDNAITLDGENLTWTGDPDYLPALRQYKDVTVLKKLSEKAAGMPLVAKPLPPDYLMTLLEEHPYSELLPSGRPDKS